MRVCIVPEYPMSLMTGGLQVQAEETCHALAAIGGDLHVELFNWSDRRPLADLYHVIGFPHYMQRIVELLQEAGRPYVLTMLFGGRGSTTQLWMARARQVVKSQLLRHRARYDSIMRSAAIITITEGDAQAARFIYGLDSARVHVVNHGINNNFFAPSPEVWQQKFGQDPFILCVGAVQARKNQLLLLQAANELKLPVVLLGPVLPGERAYSKQVADQTRINVKYGGQWLTDLRNEDPLLVSAYAACRLFALLSSAETQPLSVMQAMATQKPVLLLDAAYTRDALFKDLPAAKAPQLETVKAALRDVWENGRPTSLSRQFAWNEVASKLRLIYQSSIGESQMHSSP
jgi:glycosyltransferase involved in cell wall biosynthesis